MFSEKVFSIERDSVILKYAGEVIVVTQLTKLHCLQCILSMVSGLKVNVPHVL